MKTIALSIICVLTIAYAAIAYELPEVIGVMDMEAGLRRSTDFCCAGDMNGDGNDDLLIHNFDSTRADLFFGAEYMNDEADMFFDYRGGLEGEFVGFGEKINNLGRIFPDHDSYIALCAKIWERREERGIDYQLSLYESGEDLDDEPEMFFMRGNGDGPAIGIGHCTRPADINGDGFHDIIASESGDSLSKQQVFFCGEVFDTIPDWEVTTISSPSWINYSSGFDVNGDGYDDILFKSWEQHENDHRMKYWYRLYLGGDPMDTIPAFEFREDHFEGRFVNREMRHGFSLLSDVNDDGYDDWGIYWEEWYERYEDDGFFIFFGSEEPDMEPDLELEGHRHLWLDEGEIAGGDFNGDGIGDIVAGFYIHPDMGEIHIHFGSRRIDGETDIYIDSERNYGGEFLRMGYRVGAVGDYNGDGIDDFVTVDRGRDYHPKVIIFAGDEDWFVGMDDNKMPESYSFSIQANPNPFNSKVTISFSLIQACKVQLTVYDVQGRLVETLENRRIIKGHHRLTWTNDTSGIYFVMLDAGNTRKVKKIVNIP